MRALLFALLLLSVALALLFPKALEASLPHLSWKALLALASFMVASDALKRSGFFYWSASKLCSRGTKTLAPLAYLSGALLMNDAAMFVIIPIAVAAGASTVEVSALATLINLGSTVSPFGSPQNVLVWVKYRLPFTAFLSLFPYTLLPSLVAVTFLGKERVELRPSVDWVGAALGLCALIATVVLVQEGMAAEALILSLTIFVFKFKCLPKVDLELLAVLALMMVDFWALSGLLSIRVEGRLETFLLAAGLSQVISNVPTTVVLMAAGAPWKPLILGADLGGLGTPVASLANLIAIRLSASDALEFTKVNALLLAVALLWAAPLLALLP